MVKLFPQLIARGRLALRRHRALAAILVTAAVLVGANLGRDGLWEDEGDTAVLAASILTYGVPTAWDGVTFTDADYGERLNDHLVMISHPWAQYYAVAASFAVFGQTRFAARLPFALAGLGTIALLYLLAWRMTGSRRVALGAALLLTMSVQFLLFARESRNYTLHAFLTCLLLWQFFRLRSWGSCILYALIGIALFHTHPIGLAAILALAALTLGYAPFERYRRWSFYALAIMSGPTVAWLIVALRGYGQNTKLLERGTQFLPRLVQFGVEWLSVTPLIGIIALWAYVLVRRPARPPDLRPARDLVVAVCAIALVEAAAIALTQSREAIWMLGLRHTPALLPLAMLLAGLALVRAAPSRAAWLALLLIFGLTKLARVTPWAVWEDPTPFPRPSQLATFHQPPQLIDRVFRTGQLGFLHSLVASNPGTTMRVVEFLKTHAKPDDILVTNYAWEPLYFETGLRQGMKILPHYPIYETARALGLPDYVFTGGKPRWIVWRQAWGTAWGQDCAKLVASLQRAGVAVEQVATLPETLWENRENIHFRRFPGDRYIYPWYEQVPDTLIYRVDWPPG